MAQAKQASKKQASKRKRRNTALPVLGAAGITLALASGASATAPAANAPSQDSGPRITPPITLGEEEISDVSLGTFYVFDKENENHLGQDVKLARACGGCRGCGRGCGGCRGCGRGCGGCRACGGGCGGFRGCGGCGGGLWIGACLGCGGGCGSCWTWSSYYGRWVYAC